MSALSFWGVMFTFWCGGLRIPCYQKSFLELSLSNVYPLILPVKLLEIFCDIDRTNVFSSLGNVCVAVSFFRLPVLTIVILISVHNEIMS